MRWFLAIMGMVMVSACAEIDRPALEGLTPSGEGFAAHLARGYKDQALAADRAGAGTAAARLGAKALAASMGRLDGPDPISDRLVVYVRAENADESPIADHLRMPGQNRPPHPRVDYEEDGIRVPPEVFPAMAEARRRLIGALARGARHSHAAQSAEAQVAFDCWVGRVGEPAAEQCRGRALDLLAGLETETAGKPFFIDTPNSGSLRPCPKDERLFRHYSLDRDATPSAEVAEVIDRARLESAAGQACSETSVR